ncbi:MAG TPA: metallophosphoesterase [Polyangiaceae bacterium]|nr:metallophosphoesterase [Polyangiaceae bacterium]
MTERLIVLSDLHLAPPGPLNNFHAGHALAAFVQEIARPDVTLVLAGDAFDFLQVDDRPGTLDGPAMPALIRATLDAVADTPWGRDLYKNLGDLLDRGGRCVVLPGNHDPEVAHPSFREDLLAKAGRPPNHPGLTVHTRGPWRTNIGPREIVVGHGHRHDPWNDIHPDTVEAALQGQPAALPPGSRLVTEVLNAFKNARDERGALRFPFVDLLKPEVPAVPLLLLYLDHDRAMKHLLPALDVGVDALTEKLAKALLGSDTLGPGTAAPTTSPAHDIARALAVTYTATERKNPRRCADDLGDWLHGEDSGVVEGTLAAHGGIRPRLLRAFLRSASDEGRFFNREHLSGDDRAIVLQHLPPNAPPRVVIAGHTHAAREVWLNESHAYINTGTWTDLIEYPAKIDDAELRTWIDRLERREIPRVQRLTYAEVTPEKGTLESYPPGSS